MKTLYSIFTISSGGKVESVCWPGEQTAFVSTALATNAVAKHIEENIPRHNDVRYIVLPVYSAAAREGKS